MFKFNVEPRSLRIELQNQEGYHRRTGPFFFLGGGGGEAEVSCPNICPLLTRKIKCILPEYYICWSKMVSCKKTGRGCSPTPTPPRTPISMRDTMHNSA